MLLASTTKLNGRIVCHLRADLHSWLPCGLRLLQQGFPHPEQVVTLRPRNSTTLGQNLPRSRKRHIDDIPDLRLSSRRLTIVCLADPAHVRSLEEIDEFGWFDVF